jgi:hypothetical protein
LWWVSSIEDHGPEIPAVIVNRGSSYARRKETELSFFLSRLLFERGYPAPYGILGEFGHRVQAELIHDSAAVRFNRFNADVEPVGGLLRGAAFDDELQRFSPLTFVLAE